MCILKPQVFVQDQVLRSLIAKAIKVSKQGRIGQKDDFQNT